MKIIPYGHQWLDKDDIKEAVKALKSDWISSGPRIKAFEDVLCKYTGAKYAVCVSSGTAALHIACLSAGIKHNDQVITSAVTFIASANSILYCGGRSVFADVQADTVNICPQEIKNKITADTKAVIPVHFGGHPCELEEIAGIAKKHGLAVIEDGAHALGAKYKGTKIGSCKYSDMTIFSFHPVKSITTGEGGAVLTNRLDLYEKLQRFRNHGLCRDREKMSKYEGPWYYEMQELGFNYRITDFQSAIGLAQLNKLDKFIRLRREIAGEYNRRLSDIDEVILPMEKPYVKSAWHIYYLRVKNPAKRKDAFEQLQNARIGVQVHYIPVYLHPYYERIGFKKGLCPNAEDYYRRAISIPMYPVLKSAQIKYVINKIHKIFARLK